MPEPIFMWSDLVSSFGVWLTCVPLILGILVFRKSDVGIRAIVFLSAASLLSDVIITIGDSRLIGTIASRAYSFVEFVLVSIFFLYTAKRSWMKKVVWTVMVLFPIVVVGDAILSHEKNLRDDPVTVCESIIFVTYSVITLYIMMKDMEYKSITSTLHFWLLSGLLVYFGGAIFVFSSSNYAASISMRAFDVVWTIHACLSITYNLVISSGYWKLRKAYQ